MRASRPTVVHSRSVEPDWSLERDHGEAHDVNQSPYPNHSLAVEHGDAPPAKINHLALSDASRQAPSGIAFFKAAHNPVVIIQ
jgi:hypothetical protein